MNLIHLQKKILKMKKWMIISSDKLNMNLNRRILYFNNRWKLYKIIQQFIDHKRYQIKLNKLNIELIILKYQNQLKQKKGYQLLLLKILVIMQDLQKMKLVKLQMIFMMQRMFNKKLKRMLLMILKVMMIKRNRLLLQIINRKLLFYKKKKNFIIQ